MTKPTHTHKTQGGRFAMVAHYNGDTSLEAQMIVVYRDLDRETDTATTAKDWETNWRPIATDDCPVCLGSGHDHIKVNKSKQCGGCYGLGKVKEDGQRPEDLWQLADVATHIIQRKQHELEQRRRAMATPAVREAIQRERERAVSESTTRQHME